MPQSDKIPLIVISGPTASGKSNLAFRIAKKINGEIISADSRQVYEEFDIGVNKPPKDMLEGIPHHLIGHIPVTETYNASKFKEDSTRCIEAVSSRGKIPIVAGGTGLYIQMLLQNKEMPPSDSQLRDKLMGRADDEGLPVLYDELSKADPDYAAVISPNDRLRIVRALEIYELSGKNMTYFNNLAHEPPYNYIHFVLDIDRARLYNAINGRVGEMLDAGLIDEVKYLYSKYGDSHLMHTIGYAEVVGYLRDGISYDTMKVLIAQHTRNYAKRQIIWNRKVIKNDPERVVVLSEPDEQAVINILRERKII